MTLAPQNKVAATPIEATAMVTPKVVALLESSDPLPLPLPLEELLSTTLPGVGGVGPGVTFG